MGFRTIVGLNNDFAHEWQHDPKLGDKIWEASCRMNRQPNQFDNEFRFGQVIEQVHADTQTVFIAEHYGGQALVHGHWYRNQTPEQRNLELLKAFADKLGYRVSKKPVQTAREAGL
jgi:hypothetical protein